jgi:dTDP-D-glucose 4,6-dehydratase
MGDCDFVSETGMDGGAPYSSSKAAVNMVVAKYDATYKSDGVLVMENCAGAVSYPPNRRL